MDIQAGEPSLSLAWNRVRPISTVRGVQWVPGVSASWFTVDNGPDLRVNFLLSTGSGVGGGPAGHRVPRGSYPKIGPNPCDLFSEKVSASRCPGGWGVGSDPGVVTIWARWRQRSFVSPYAGQGSRYFLGILGSGFESMTASTGGQCVVQCSDRVHVHRQRGGGRLGW